MSAAATPNVSKYPLDFETLEKGSWIETSDLCDAIGIGPSDSRWGLKVLRVIEMVRQERGILGCQIGNRIRLMTDAEASIYVYRQSGIANRKQRRCAENLTLIEPGALNEGELRSHEARSRVVAATAVASHRAQEKQRKIEGLLTSGSFVGRLQITD